MKILIAEDQPEILELMEDGISEQGYEVVSAKDGIEAWEKIKSEAPDIILLDLMMPKMNGYEVLKKLRENPPSDKWQPVIIISALSEFRDMKKSFVLEADHYITKPWELSDIIQGIKTMASLIPQRKKTIIRKERGKVLMKVLIAEDEREVLEIMGKRVSQEGYDVITAHDGAQAWEKIQSDDPDIILLDLTMPKMDGLTVLEKLRESPPSKKWQPVIIITARDELADIQKGFSLEADHYITKPCNMDDVIKGIKMMQQLIPQRKSQTEMDSDQGR